MGRYSWTAFQDKFEWYITLVLPCGFMQKLSISAIISRAVLPVIDISPRFLDSVCAHSYKFYDKNRINAEGYL